MEKQVYRSLAAAGPGYWWHRGRHDLLARLWRKFGPGPAADGTRPKILDIGCAAGGTLAFLSQWGEVWGVDSSPEALSLCREWGMDAGRLVLNRAENLSGFREGQFDLVTAVEVLEHVERPPEALAEIRRVLKPGGLLILTVPADPRLWSERDLRLGHFRRYRLGQLVREVGGAELEVVKASYANAFYYWPFRCWLAWRRLWARRRVPEVKQDIFPVPRALGGLLVAVLKLETWMILHGRLPWGVSAICAARKPGAAA